ncbi:isoprenylcysteine carboxylmethyltransferase family protein [Rhizobacter sp. AJA081-3]|uniref:methyltransferase family protein n=1 Tax=Rhizobacter sp. AJA081-3 TaxID=2753607 RepID=UPI001ADFEE03|nr:isoprenylcysteine carboxylmethyltransferase family protein [Rhizobacter sp. AJA081-3]QTN21832.1 isoprenylcysteine carboxylmethyltransferase family protein [Rhizobacter sp. AJA081-3]
MAGAAEGGVALMLAGIGWAMWAAWQLRRAGAPVRPGAAAGVLVEEGPYRFGRNPMSLGLTVALLGAAVAFGSFVAAVAAFAYAAYMHLVRIPREEAQLRGTFGGWYSDYTATVRRWL